MIVDQSLSFFVPKQVDECLLHSLVRCCLSSMFAFVDTALSFAAKQLAREMHTIVQYLPTVNCLSPELYVRIPVPSYTYLSIRPWAKYFYLDTTSYLAVFTISQNQRLLVLVSAFPPHVRKLTVGNLILPTGEYIHIPPRI